MVANYTIHQYATNNNWAGLDAFGSPQQRRSALALQRRKLRDECTLRDADDEVIPFVAFKRELVEGKLDDPNDPDKKIWVPDRREVLRIEMKHADSLTGAGGVLAVLVAWGVTTIVA